MAEKIQSGSTSMVTPAELRDLASDYYMRSGAESLANGGNIAAAKSLGSIGYRFEQRAKYMEDRDISIGMKYGPIAD